MKQFISRRSFMKVACLTAATMPLLTGCTKKEKSEKKILEDLQVEDYMYQKYGLEIESSEITKRQTNPDNKTDYVWISVSSSNSDFIYNVDYELEYRLYNDGWLLEFYWCDDWNYTPLSYPTEDEALAEVKSNYSDAKYEGKYDEGSYVLLGSDQGTNNITYFIECTVVNKYLTTIYVEEVKYEYTLTEEWSCSISESISSENYDFIGEWEYVENGKNFHLNILSFDMENKAITLEYNLEGWVRYGNFDLRLPMVSNGVVTLEMYKDSKWLGDSKGYSYYWCVSFDPGYARIEFSYKGIHLYDYSSDECCECWFTKL